MILLIIIIFTTHQNTLIYEFNATSNILEGWEYQSSYLFSTYEGIQYFGSPKMHDIFYYSRIFLDLDPHSHIIVDAQFLFINKDYQPSVSIDSQSQSYELVISPQSQIPNSAQPEYLRTLSITRQHNRRTIWIQIYQHFGGLISLKLSIIKCKQECSGCIDNYHAICQQWKLHQYSFNQKNFTYSDGWTFQQSQQSYFECGNCQFLQFKQIKYKTQLPSNQDVLIRFFVRPSPRLVVDYKYGQKTFNNPYSQQIEILIKNHPDPILQLNIQTFGPMGLVRDFEVFYTQPEKMFQNLNEGCLEQIDDKCLICQEGWILDEFQENCHPICGDGIIQGQEQCDDLISNQSCYQCKYSCIENCQICQFGICLQCIDGFVINANFNCDPLCGDGNLIPYSVEQCELTVNGVWDGCYDCKFISIVNCKTNYFQICLQCEIGFLNLENACFPYCGDKLVLQQYEDCDDGNFEPYDGCYQCKFQCIEECNICDQGKCILKCGEGYEFVNNNCHSVCGDYFVTKEEDCDDGNTIEFDGCFQCKYSCPENCYDCFQGNVNLYLFQIVFIIFQKLSKVILMILAQSAMINTNYQFQINANNNQIVEMDWFRKKRIAMMVIIMQPMDARIVQLNKIGFASQLQKILLANAHLSKLQAQLLITSI